MWFRRRKRTANPVLELRRRLLAARAAELGLVAGAPTEAWGVLMETAYPDAVVTLVALADGTTSLYFSNGGGIIGAGAHDRFDASEMLDENPGAKPVLKRFAEQAAEVEGRLIEFARANWHELVLHD